METMHISRLSTQEVKSDLELSLKALSVDAIDIYCYHRDDISRSVEELIETMQDFVRAGKIRYYGCSNWSTERIQAADAYCKKMSYRGFIVNEALYNYGSDLMRDLPDKTMVRVDDNMLEYHAKNPGNVLTPYMSLCSAFFHTLDSKGEDAVKQSPYYTEGNLDLYQSIKLLTAKYQVGITQILLGYILSRNLVMLPLISADTIEHLEEAMDTFNQDFQTSEF
jgi:aryl-alcohol dehydrogenase-like predicted oxidoreductase